MDYSNMAFPKPKDIEKETEAVHIYPDGREVCQTDNAAGRAEYRRRLEVCWDVQDGHCAICHLPMRLEEATVDHIRLRKMGASERDDRLHNIAAVHARCNGERGSKRHGYYAQ